MKFHIIYTLNGKVTAEIKSFKSFKDVEVWLEGIGASYWEIGMSQEDYIKSKNEIHRTQRG